MCGVIGFHSPNPSLADRVALQELFIQSKIRGLHAFGIAYVDPDGSTQIFKSHNLGEMLLKLQTLEPFPNTLIGHNRYSTSGDWQDHRNNQPIFVDSLALVFNGVIDMRSRKDWQREYQTRFQTDNDGEIFLRRLLAGEAPKQFFKQHPCSFAGLWINKGEAFAIRNANRPMWKATRGQALFIASTQDIFTRAVPELAPVSIPPLTLLRLSEAILSD